MCENYKAYYERKMENSLDNETRTITIMVDELAITFIFRNKINMLYLCNGYILRNGGLIVKINYTVLIGQGEDGAYIASVPAIKGCHTQATTMSELLDNIREAIELCLEVEKDIPASNKFIGIQQMEIAI